jgi:2-methylcitrate dehydratase PrpD
MSVAAKIARFVVETKYEDLPSRAVEVGKTAFIDCLGVALAGSKEASAKICAQIARQESASGEATVFGQGFKSSALNAAFINGTAAHALDYDHGFTLMGQPTAPIIPAVLALGESVGASGRQLLEAYAVGFEVTGKLVLSLRDSTQNGWHAPGTLGCFGATVACAKLLPLKASEVEMALGITASMASGIVSNFGTMTKPLHVGLGAKNGVLAAKLAQSGYTANAQALEAGNGFYDMYYRSTPAGNSPLEQLGQSYELEKGIKIKPYPCGGLTHAAIDAVLDIRARQRVTPQEVEAVDVDVSEHTYNRIVFNVPQTGLEGKFSMGYILSRALIDGKVGLDAFTDAAVCDRRVLELAERVNMRLDRSLKQGNEGSRPCRVLIRLKNGTTLSREIEFAKGGAEVPLSPQELREKFAECARQAIDEKSIERVLEYVERLETLKDIRPFCELLLG